MQGRRQPGRRWVRRLASVLGAIAGVALAGVALAAGPAGATGREPGPLESALEELEAELTQKAAEVEAVVDALGAGLQAEVDAAITEAQAVVGAALADAPPELRASAERLFVALRTPGCGPHPLETPLAFGAGGRYLRRTGATVTATVTVHQPLCSPLDVTLASYVKSNPEVWFLGHQTLHDSDTKTVQAAGTYTWTVSLPTAPDGRVCATQTDFYRGTNPPSRLEGLDVTKLLAPEAGIDIAGFPVDVGAAVGQVVNVASGNNGINALNLIDYIQLDAPQFAGCLDVGGAVATRGGDPGVQVAGITGELPATGAETLPLAATGVLLLGFGWIVLAAASLLGPGHRTQPSS
ncbi:MAG: hypothetical protein M5U14_14145 [Acidimicrobiia bacterium]|nr:hypothetical protein [Acidimicrobiia bacterium]